MEDLGIQEGRSDFSKIWDFCGVPSFDQPRITVFLDHLAAGMRHVGLKAGRQLLKRLVIVSKDRECRHIAVLGHISGQKVGQLEAGPVKGDQVRIARARHCATKGKGQGNRRAGEELCDV